MRLFVHEPMKTASTGDLLERSAGGEVHVLEGALGGGPLVRVGDRRRVGNGVAQRDALAGVGAPGDEGLERVGVEEDLGVEDGVVVGREGVSSRRRRHPSPALSARAGDP